jgi:hypothetical protein
MHLPRSVSEIDQQYANQLYGPIAQYFRPRRHLFPASGYHPEGTQRFQTWRVITDTARAT